MIKIEQRIYEINPGLSRQERTHTLAGCFDISQPRKNPSKKYLKLLAKSVTYLLFGASRGYIDNVFSIGRWSVIFRNYRILIRYSLFFLDVLFEDQRWHFENV